MREIKKSVHRGMGGKTRLLAFRAIQYFSLTTCKYIEVILPFFSKENSSTLYS